jgi:hypothetical protein
MRLSVLLLASPLAPLAGLPAQSAPGAELWRVAAATLPLPPALTTGATASFWNPAQSLGATGQVGLDLIQGADAVGASGVMAGVRLRVKRVGSLGLVYGRMGLSDLVRTSDSPDPTGASIPFYDQALKMVWSATLHGFTAGAGLVYHETRFDGATIDRWGLELGLVQQVGSRLRLAASAPGLRRVGSDPAQDLHAGVEFLVWRGALWQGAPGAVRMRYGLSGGHPGAIDHQFGAGLEVGQVVSVDAELAREGTYGNPVWRPVAGLQVAVGRYRVMFARDGGVSDVGAAYRVGLQVRLR